MRETSWIWLTFHIWRRWIWMTLPSQEIFGTLVKMIFQYELRLPRTVYGGDGHVFQRIYDVPAFINSLLHNKTRLETLFGEYVWRLSSASPDWYEQIHDRILPPFYVQFVTGGPRLGWCWYESFFGTQSRREIAVITKHIFGRWEIWIMSFTKDITYHRLKRNIIVWSRKHQPMKIACDAEEEEWFSVISFACPPTNEKAVFGRLPSLSFSGLQRDVTCALLFWYI